MRALVTGGTGLVGGPLVRRLLAEGWEVTLVTRRPAVAAALGGAVRVLEADPADAAAMARLSGPAAGCDTCFHLAASMEYFGAPDELHRANVDGTRHVLALAERAGVGRFVHVSSIEAMGPVRARDVPAPAAGPCRPVSPYGESKRRGEEAVWGQDGRSLSAVVVRIGNVYAEQHFSFLLDVATALVTRSRLLEFLASYRDRYLHPVHVNDVVAGLLAAARPGAPAATVMVGGAPARVGELFDLCGELLGRRVPDRPGRWTDATFVRLWQRYHRHRQRLDLMSYVMTGAMGRVHRAYSIAEAHALFGYSPGVSLRDGAREALRWHHAHGRLPAGPVS